MTPARPLLAAAAWLCVLCIPSWRAQGAEDGFEYVVRLAVCRDTAAVRVQARELAVRDADVLDVLVRRVDHELTIRAVGEVLDIPGVKHRPRGALLVARGPIQVDGRSLVGEVEILAEGGRGLLVVNRLPLERYLEGLLGAEMSASWPLEALKAQAVAARSYFLHRRLARESEPFDLSVTTLDQVYKGIGREAASTRQAVQATRGEVLTHGNLPAESLFHGCCGGRTRSAEQVFGQAVPYLRAVEDPDCAACPGRAWRVSVPMTRLEERLRARKELSGAIREVQPGERGGLSVRGATGAPLELSPRKLRQVMGATLIPSDDFTWRLADGSLELSGRGQGHGVGMCQWGARGMAERGKNHREILARFYPGCNLRKLY